MSHRTAEQVGLVLVAPFWFLGWIVIGVIGGFCEGALIAWSDIRREWYV